MKPLCASRLRERFVSPSATPSRCARARWVSESASPMTVRISRWRSSLRSMGRSIIEHDAPVGQAKGNGGPGGAALLADDLDRDLPAPRPVELGDDDRLEAAERQLAVVQ